MIRNHTRGAFVAFSRKISREFIVAEIHSRRGNGVDSCRDTGFVHQLKLSAEAPISPRILAAAVDANAFQRALIVVWNRVLVGID